MQFDIELCHTSGIFWHTPDGQWEMKRLGDRKWSLDGSNPPVSFLFSDANTFPAKPPTPCPSPSMFWSYGTSPAGGTWTILASVCSQQIRPTQQTMNVQPLMNSLSLQEEQVLQEEPTKKKGCGCSRKKRNETPPTNNDTAV